MITTFECPIDSEHTLPFVKTRAELAGLLPAD